MSTLTSAKRLRDVSDIINTIQSGNLTKKTKNDIINILNNEVKEEKKEKIWKMVFKQVVKKAKIDKQKKEIEDKIDQLEKGSKNITKIYGDIFYDISRQIFNNHANTRNIERKEVNNNFAFMDVGYTRFQSLIKQAIDVDRKYNKLIDTKNETINELKKDLNKLKE